MGKQAGRPPQRLGPSQAPAKLDPAALPLTGSGLKPLPQRGKVYQALGLSGSALGVERALINADAATHGGGNADLLDKGALGSSWLSLNDSAD